MLPKDIQIIGDKISSQLPGEKAHLDMLPQRAASTNLLRSAKDYRESAVSVLLYHEFDQLKSILIQRPNYEGKHGGQVSFPGGKKDPTDPDLTFTALREMHEEIGFQDEQITFVGDLTRVFIPVSNFLVFPKVFYTQKTLALKPDPREVEEILPFTLNTVQNPALRKSTKIKLDNSVILKDIPFFDIENKVVWGATALILNEMRMILD